MGKRNNKNNIKAKIIGIIIVILIILLEQFEINIQEYLGNIGNEQYQETLSYDLSQIPEYKNSPYVIINNNIPNFTEEDYITEEFEEYSKLDALGRCGVAFANICKEIMPNDNEEREDLNYNPTGWKQKEYKGLVEGDYLYNRCHLIGWQLAGENDNKLNLITGTRYMNVDGMLPFENMVAEYIDVNTKNHVLYRVTPIFEGNDKVAKGVQMEAYSVEDDGNGVCFNVFVYNVQPGIEIDYATGQSTKQK